MSRRPSLVGGLAVLVVVSVAPAQPPGPPGPPGPGGFGGSGFMRVRFGGPQTSAVMLLGMPEVRKELGETMDGNVAVFREAEGLQKALETVKRLKEEAQSCYIDDHGTVFNQDAEALRSDSRYFQGQLTVGGVARTQLGRLATPLAQDNTTSASGSQRNGNIDFVVEA